MPEAILTRTIPPTRGSWRWLAVLAMVFIALRSLTIWKAYADPFQAHFIGKYIADGIKLGLNSDWKGAATEYPALRALYFHGRPVWQVLLWPIIADSLLFIGLYSIAWRKDNHVFLKLRKGLQVSGPRLHKPKSFQRTVKGDGMSIAIAPPKLIEQYRPKPRTYIHIPKEKEVEHFAISGAPGSGKTTQMQWLIDSAMERAEKEGRKLVCIFFDPHGSFIKRYYKPGDWVANPYDRRGFSWCPTWELDLNRKKWSMARALSMARSIYVGKQSAHANDNSGEFFNRTAQLLFQQLVVDHQPRESQELAFWFNHPDEEICTRVTGKIASDLSPGSLPQKNGIMSSASMPAQAFEAIPLSGWTLPDGTWHMNAPRWTVKDYCLHRDRNLFLTSTADTIDALQPYYSMLLDMLFRQIIGMGVESHQLDFLFVIDEADAAQRLPWLQKAMNQIRKFGTGIMLGFQSRNQFDAIYGRDVASAILAAAKTQIYHRTGEGDAAEWESKNIGEIEYEELMESFHRSSLFSGRNDQTNQVRTEIKRKFLFKPSDFMGLPDRHAIMRFENEVVQYRVALSPRRVVTEAFIPRPDAPAVKGVKRDQLPVGNPKNAPAKQTKEKPEKPSDGSKPKRARGKKTTNEEAISVDDVLTPGQQNEMGLSDF